MPGSIRNGLTLLLVRFDGEAELAAEAAALAGGGPEPEASDQAAQAGLGFDDHGVEQAAHPELQQVDAHRAAVELLERGREVVGIQLKQPAHALQGDLLVDLPIELGGGRQQDLGATTEVLPTLWLPGCPRTTLQTDPWSALGCRWPAAPSGAAGWQVAFGEKRWAGHGWTRRRSGRGLKPRLPWSGSGEPPDLPGAME